MFRLKGTWKPHPKSIRVNLYLLMVSNPSVVKNVALSMNVTVFYVIYNLSTTMLGCKLS